MCLVLIAILTVGPWTNWNSASAQKILPVELQGSYVVTQIMMHFCDNGRYCSRLFISYCWYIGVSLSLTYLNLNALIKRFNTVSKCSIAKKTLKCSIKYMSKISIMVFKYTTVKKEAEI